MRREEKKSVKCLFKCENKFGALLRSCNRSLFKSWSPQSTKLSLLTSALWPVLKSKSILEAPKSEHTHTHTLYKDNTHAHGYTIFILNHTIACPRFTWIRGQSRVAAAAAAADDNDTDSVLLQDFSNDSFTLHLRFAAIMAAVIPERWPHSHSLYDSLHSRALTPRGHG